MVALAAGAFPVDAEAAHAEADEKHQNGDKCEDVARVDKGLVHIWNCLDIAKFRKVRINDFYIL